MIDNRPTQNGLSDIFRRDVKDVYVTVRDNNVDQALRVLKKKMQREGVFREMKNRRSFEKPSERRARERLRTKYQLRELMTSPMAGLDDSGLAQFLKERAVAEGQGGLF